LWQHGNEMQSKKIDEASKKGKKEKVKNTEDRVEGEEVKG